VDKQALTILAQLLTKHQPTLTATQKAQVIAAYQPGLNMVVTQGWLTQAQATILVDMVQGL
jgi:hypothetical protein